LQTIIEKTVGEFHWVYPNVIYLTNHSYNSELGYQNIFMKLEYGFAPYQVFWGDNCPDPGSSVRASGIERTYLLIDDLVYFPLCEVPRLTNFIIFTDAGDVFIYTPDFYEANHTIFEDIGREMSLTAHINDIRINSPVFRNASSDNFWSNSFDYFFILLIPALEAVGAEISFVEPNIIMAQAEEFGQIEFRAGALVDTATGTVTEFEDGTRGCFIIDGDIYIEFVMIRVATEGALRQLGNEMFVYTPNFERSDVPSTMEEAYVLLNDLLEPDLIAFIKEGNEDIIMLHIGLGMWIRNNWIYPVPGMIAQEFVERGVTHPDSISWYIILGYHEYLNGRPSDIDSIIGSNLWF